ncbi:MAG: nucleotide exchange factor GrpE [Bacteroidales bacterium]|nr:nucleotide exchange factor GrpE [Candidatus Cacconaster caballi]
MKEQNYTESTKEENVDETVEQPQSHEEGPKSRKAAKQAAKVAELEKRLEEAEAKAEAARDQYVRMAAEFDNYRRRTAKERLELVGSAGRDILMGILPVVDDCERALQVLRQSDAGEAAIEGTELIYNKLTGFLKSKGMEKIEAKGQEFNTDFHEAVAQFPVQDESLRNKVYDVTQEGYTLNGTVVRFAKVVVGI